MLLLDRYLFAIGQYLPAQRRPGGETREDILAELRANLSEQIADQAESLGRPLTDAELSAIIRDHGRPSAVAAQYAPQQPVIGPGMLPHYWMILRKGLPLILVVYAVTQTVLLGNLWSVFWGSLSVLFLSWAWITLAFFIFELVATRLGRRQPAWDPARLSLLPTTQPASAKTRANRIADLVVNTLFTAWLVAIPFQPCLILGPGIGYLRGVSAGLSPEWHTFYLEIVTLAIVSLFLKILILFTPSHPWQRICELVVQALGIAAFAVMVQARTYFAPSSLVPDAATLLTINTMLNLSFRIALAVSLLSLAWNIWNFAAKTRTRHTAVVA